MAVIDVGVGAARAYAPLHVKRCVAPSALPCLAKEQHVHIGGRDPKVVLQAGGVPTLPALGGLVPPPTTRVVVRPIRFERRLARLRAGFPGAQVSLILGYLSFLLALQGVTGVALGALALPYRVLPLWFLGLTH